MIEDGLTIELGDTVVELGPTETLTIGREADLVPDAENHYLHRRMIEIQQDARVWWVENVGTAIPIALAGGNGSFRAWLGPGVRLPVVLPEILAEFTAGGQRYQVKIRAENPPYRESPSSSAVGTATIGDQNLTPSQRMLILALAEPLLRSGSLVAGDIPTSAAAADRLGWPLTTFNRKLDNVCDKLDRLGVDGMRGGVGNLATNRKARLVEYAILSRTVTLDDLVLLDSVSPTISSKD